MGAGPVGLSLAVECLRRGLRIRIVDMSPLPSQHSKALAIWSAAQEVFSAMGVVAEMRRQAFHPAAIQLRAPGKTLIRVPTGSLADTPFPDVLILPQSATERILGDRVEALGGRVERPVEMMKLDQDPGAVHCTLRLPEGAEEVVESDYVVGCDGAHSAVRHALGIRFEGRSLPECFVLCDARLEGDPQPQPDVQITFSHTGPVAMFPLGDEMWRVVASRGGQPGNASPTLEEMQEHIDAAGYSGLKLADPRWLSAFRISERRVERFRQGRVLLAGDSAHIHSPAGGQGMNTGVQDAFNLGWKLECILRHGAGPGQFLESYSAERAPIAQSVISGSSQLTRIATLPCGPLSGIRNLVARGIGRSRAAVRNIGATLSGIQWHYDAGSPVICPEEGWDEDWEKQGFSPGWRIRDARIHQETEAFSILQMVLGSTKHYLLAFSGRQPNYRDADRIEACAVTARQHALPIEVLRIWRGAHTPGHDWFSDPDSEAHRRFGANGPAIYLVRPDSYVAGRLQPPDALKVRRMLNQAAGLEG